MLGAAGYLRRQQQQEAAASVGRARVPTAVEALHAWLCRCSLHCAEALLTGGAVRAQDSQRHSCSCQHPPGSATPDSATLRWTPGRWATPGAAGARRAACCKNAQSLQACSLAKLVQRSWLGMLSS